ncbi:hypothetical protein [Pandoraea horticolens]|uniref:hypothetical protein n=1 Tax=Pandoraea horticolens TaxID=2508298 RepID=UPI0012426495|nr:hypothetical protein [Pandoraea horticolens]
MLATASTGGRTLAAHFALVILGVGVTVVVLGALVVFTTVIVFGAATLRAVAGVVIAIVVRVGRVLFAIFRATALLALRIAVVSIVLVFHFVVLGALFVFTTVIVFGSCSAGGNSGEMSERKPARRKGANTHM